MPKTSTQKFAVSMIRLVREWQRQPHSKSLEDPQAAMIEVARITSELDRKLTNRP